MDGQSRLDSILHRRAIAVPPIRQAPSSVSPSLTAARTYRASSDSSNPCRQHRVSSISFHPGVSRFMLPSSSQDRPHTSRGDSWFERSNQSPGDNCLYIGFRLFSRWSRARCYSLPAQLGNVAGGIAFVARDLPVDTLAKVFSLHYTQSRKALCARGVVVVRYRRDRSGVEQIGARQVSPQGKYGQIFHPGPGPLRI